MLLKVFTCFIYAVLMPIPSFSEDMTNSSTLFTTSIIPVRLDTDDDMGSDDNMNLGTQVLMVVYIGAAVVLSVVPFGIYFYITCKKLGFGKFCKRVLNRCRKKPNTDDDTSVARPWPYRSRPEEYGESGAIYMIDLPTYDEVMRNTDTFKITNDIKVFYSVYYRQSSRETQTNQTTQTDVLVQTDTVGALVNSEPPDETNDVRTSENQENSGQLVSDADQSIS
ncbi:hypothetical protein LOTGIDRAFT_238845 [Lottia gigantea]|uniref:Uncharacterized protein n=1 Tax=Lottia gigantea TaxID=225164 RepID=V4AZG2_LOTGI|nr:hypothetical protein LOTGIDRAFT_238845 [Lottia gigantea]ESO99116.1 hypothetical protein LOTGIDRAFT_238845 [Lottia gigantea]